METMKEVREVAMAYYARASPEYQNLAHQFFRSLDTNGNGKVSLAEFKALLGPELEHFFKQLDKNGDGALDFEEVMALYYLQKSGIRFCNGCTKMLPGFYFSCLQCEKDFPNSYDLCVSCYGGGSVQHHHSPASFLDNNSMRLLMGQIINNAEISQPDIQKMRHNIEQLTSESESTTSESQSTAWESRSTYSGHSIWVSVGREAVVKFGEIIDVPNLVVNVGNYAAQAGCNIM